MTIVGIKMEIVQQVEYQARHYLKRIKFPFLVKKKMKKETRAVNLRFVLLWPKIRL